VLAHGALRIDVKVTVEPEVPPLPRVGVLIRLVEKSKGVTWYGRGPHENYPDRKASADFGRWQSTIEELHTPYIFPSENGLRCDVSLLKIGAAQVSGDFAFCVSEFGLDQLMRADHNHELVAQPGLFLHIDGFHMGVGGDDSWSPSVRPEYLLAAKYFEWSFVLGERATPSSFK
jgi:beta-galactosidase